LRSRREILPKNNVAIASANKTPDPKEMASAAVVPHRRDHEVAKKPLYFRRIRRCAGRTLSIKKRDGPQLIAEPQHIEGYAKVVNSKSLPLYSCHRHVLIACHLSNAKIWLLIAFAQELPEKTEFRW